jgi:DNA-binding protein YbaB
VRPTLGAVHDLYRTWDQVAAIEETAWSPDGYVTASVGARGELRDLVLDPRIYRDADADALATSIRDTVVEAARLARRQAFDALRPLLAPYATEDEADLAFDPLLHHLDSGG